MSLETAIRDLVREVVRDEIRPLREELRAVAKAVRAQKAARDSSGGEFLTVEEVAAKVKVNKGTVRSWIQSGKLRASRPGSAGRVGRVYRISRPDLESVLAAAQSAPEDDVDIKAEAARIVAELARKRRR